MSRLKRHPISLPLAVAGSLRAAPSLLRVKPAVSAFMLRYMARFPVRSVGGRWWVHSHLPPLNSAAYGRFVRQHLVARVPGPSHAQVGVTDACPQRCAYCYNRQRHGRRLDTDEILRAVDDLKTMGVVWLGLTGGEPLLDSDLPRIVAHAGGDCCVKLFTSGCGLTAGLAGRLADAGLDSVCVSLDSADAAAHDATRGYPGAYDAALGAIEAFLSTERVHVGVSAVVSRQAIVEGEVAGFLDFLEGLGLHEAWVSEVKPSVAAGRDEQLVISDEERRSLCRLQDAWNSDRSHSMTVNYLGHFEGAEAFGCNAGVKMVYVDAFGEVSPCVFTPLSFGNVRERPLADLVADMHGRFRPQSRCWINSNFDAVHAEAGSDVLLDRRRSDAVLARCTPGPPPAFERVFRGAPAAAGEASSPGALS